MKATKKLTIGMATYDDYDGVYFTLQAIRLYHPEILHDVEFLVVSRQCLGGNGYVNDFATGRLLRDAKLYEIGAGTSEIRRMLIGREIFEKTK